MTFIKIIDGVEVAAGAWTQRAQQVFTPELLCTIRNIQRELGRRREQLLAARRRRYEHFDQGKLPEYLDKNSEVVTGDWKVAPIPEDLRVRRVEITGPVNDTKMVINMLSRNAAGDRADMAMLDFEDSMKPAWTNVVDGIHNVIGASLGELSATKTDEKGTIVKTYSLDPDDMAGVMVRVRGLHLEESNIRVDGRPVHGGLVDFVSCFFHAAKNLLERGLTPKYYVPKVEDYLEARWWNDLFILTQEACGAPRGTLRATFLIETLPAALQIEEILFEIREHAAGLNVGRWDKIFSDIKVLKKHTSRITSDRANIGMNKFWMDNYAKRLIKICHERGAFAIGGMSAFTPGADPAVRAKQTAKVTSDKQNEFDIGHDGCWVSHPYFIGPAMKCFVQDNQLNRKLENFPRYPNLIMEGEGPRTMEGLLTNIRVGIAYMHGWNQDIGCVAYNGLMEDLATLEISRAQTWQWIYHKVTLNCGTIVTRELVEELFIKELGNFLRDIEDKEVKLAYTKAALDAQQIFTEEELRPFLSTHNEIAKPIPQLETRFKAAVG